MEARGFEMLWTIFVSGNSLASVLKTAWDFSVLGEAVSEVRCFQIVAGRIS